MSFMTWLDLTTGSGVCFFFFQAEDGIRDADVTGVQTCALPISTAARPCSCSCSARPIAPRRTAGSPPSDRKSTRLNSSHVRISYAVFCLKKKNYTHELQLYSTHTSSYQPYLHYHSLRQHVSTTY